MSIFGNKSFFAIEYEKTRVIDKYIYINFRFWAGGQEIGDYEDEIYLHTCLSYLSDFLKLSDQRYEPELEQKNKDDVFQIIYDVMFVEPPEDVDSNFFYRKVADLGTRFHLDSIGSSSFDDKFNIILIDTSSGYERLIWRTLSDMEIHEITLPPKTFETVANQFLLDAKKYLVSTTLKPN